MSPEPSTTATIAAAPPTNPIPAAERGPNGDILRQIEKEITQTEKHQQWVAKKLLRLRYQRDEMRKKIAREAALA